MPGVIKMGFTKEMTSELRLRWNAEKEAPGTNWENTLGRGTTSTRPLRCSMGSRDRKASQPRGGHKERRLGSQDREVERGAGIASSQKSESHLKSSGVPWKGFKLI